MKTTALTYPSADGTSTVSAWLWESEKGAPAGSSAPRALVQIVHGMSEHAGRYLPFVQFLCANGFAVCANDHVGHGHTADSTEKLGHMPLHHGEDVLIRDVHTLRMQAIARLGIAVPYVLFGHSMGSFLTRTYLIRYPGAPLAGVILSGTGQAPEPVVAAGRFLCDGDMLKNGPMHRSEAISNVAFGSYNKKIEPRRSPYDWLTRDEAVVDAYAADPLCTFTPTSSLFREMLSGLATVGSAREISRMSKDIPIILMSGDADPVGGWGVQVAKVYSLLVRAGCRDVAYKFYPGARHEILNEKGKMKVWADVLDFCLSSSGLTGVGQDGRSGFSSGETVNRGTGILFRNVDNKIFKRLALNTVKFFVKNKRAPIWGSLVLSA